MIKINVMSAQLKQILSSRRWRERNLEKSREYSQKWRKANLGYIREKQREWRKNNPERQRAIGRKNAKTRRDSGKAQEYASLPKRRIAQWEISLKRLGWTVEKFEKSRILQINLCAICHEPFTKENPPCADHEHSIPPRPRELLHRKCNAAIGLLNDDVDLLKEAVRYLEFWRGRK